MREDSFSGKAVYVTVVEMDVDVSGTWMGINLEIVVLLLRLSSPIRIFRLRE